MVTLVGFAALRDLRERLERAQVEADVRNLNSALQVEMAHRIASGQEGRIAELVGSNPMRWLAAPPPGYLGEMAAMPAELDAGAWVFDRTKGELAYRPLLASHLAGAGSPPLLKWRIQAPPAGGRPPMAGGLMLVALVDYRWY